MAILKVKDYLSQNFDMKDLGTTYMILRIKLFMDPKGISSSLFHNIKKMLHKFDFYKCKSVSTPYDSSIALKKNTGVHVS